MKKQSEPTIKVYFTDLYLLGPAAASLFAYIKSTYEEGGIFNYTNKQIGKLISMSEKTASRLLVKLKKFNYITIDKSNKKFGRIIKVVPEEQRLTVDENLEEAI